jgi:hypothetical protein
LCIKPNCIQYKTKYKDDIINIFPNPSNKGFNIIFNLKDAGYVELNIYSLEGVVIENILNQNLEKGMHQFEYQSKGIPSGEYYLLLKKNGGIESKKLLIIK